MQVHANFKEKDSLSSRYTSSSQWHYTWNCLNLQVLWCSCVLCHIQGVCSNARKIIGLLYRWYYQHSDPSTLLHLYLSLVRPHTEYAAQVWDPHLYKDISSLENIQKFALRVCCKNWNMGYSELLDLCKVPSLENRRLYLKMSHMFKIVNKLCYFPPEIVLQRPTVPYFPRPSLL